MEYEDIDLDIGKLYIGQSVHASVYCPDTPGSILSATENRLCQGASMSTQHKMSTGLLGVKRGVESNGNLPHNADCLKNQDVNSWFP